MNKIILTVLFIITLSCKAQTYPLKSHTPTAEGAYLQDTDNSLPNYVGIWKGQWNNKIIILYFNELIHNYMQGSNQYRDMLIGRFKVTDLNNNILFDNTNLTDDQVKIEGMRFRKPDDVKYSMMYYDKDLCGRSGTILINFTDATKTQLQWKYMQNENWIDASCFYHGWAPADVPQPLPENIILTKQ